MSKKLRISGCGQWIASSYKLPREDERVLAVRYFEEGEYYRCDAPDLPLSVDVSSWTVAVEICSYKDGIFYDDSGKMTGWPIFWRHLPIPPTCQQAKEAI